MRNRSASAGLVLAMLAASPVRGAEPPPPGPWKFGMIVGLNLSQSAFSDNWAGGDQGSVHWALHADFQAERQVREAFHWSNLLQLAYGQTAQQRPDPDRAGRKKWSRPDKTTDLVLFESVGRLTRNAPVDPYLAFRLDTQFLDDSDPVGEHLFNPVKLSETGGIARVFRKAEDRELVSRMGFGFRQSIARTFTDATGMTTESFTTNDGGFEWQTEATYPLLDGKVRYKGKLLVFVPVFFSETGDLEEFDAIASGVDPGREAIAGLWRTPDVNFQSSFDAKITEWLGVNLYVQWIYDEFDAATDVDLSLDAAALIREVDGGVRKSGQFKQTLALAISYRFL